MTDTLFDLESTQQTTPKKGIFERPKIGRQPHPRPCQKCHLITLAVMADGLIEEHLDPINLNPVGIQAATILKIPLYRAPHPPKGPPTEYWAWQPHWEQPPPNNYLSPHHQCGKPWLPGAPIPVQQPHNTTNPNEPPPY